MLTRYRESYNLLTNSNAFAETGALDNNKVNKNNFTPNNLKAVCLGSNGILAIYYTTNNTTPRLVNFLPFTKSPSNNVEVEKALKVDKGMVDALFDGLKFSNLEEIYLFTEGFNLPEEYQQELGRLKRFVLNRELIDKSFKRLRGVCLINGVITPEFLKLSNQGTLYSQFSGANIPIETILQLKPEKDELGLIKNVELDSGEYKLDNPYILQGDNKEKDSIECRLSKHFHDERVRAKKSLEGLKKKEEAANKQQEDINKLEYARQLKKQGFNIIDDFIEVSGNKGMFSKTLDWLKSFYTEKEYSSMGYKYMAGLVNQEVLESKGVKNPKEINIWDPKVFQLDEDLQFRLFVKEDKISFTILIKLPLGVKEFQFNDKTAVNNIAYMFSNLSSTKGETYQASIMQQPMNKSIKTTREIDCPYNVIEIILVKDLLSFKNSSWKLIDYIKACKGEQNDYSQLDGLTLGSRIAVGVKPGGIKAEIFNCSGKHATSGMIGGQAGSGKTALFDSLLLQFLALGGDYGDGAVILLDAKQEWVPAWRSVFQSKGIPFYGFDGSLLNNQEGLKQEVLNRGKKTIQGFKGQVTQEVAGIIFVRTLYEIIQGIQKNACNAEDLKDFNKANVNYHGITRLPRTAILVDEINTLHNFTKGNPIVKSAFDLMTSGANLTRTSGYMWLLGGQNPSKTIIPSKDLVSLNYNIFGTMPPEIYEYYGVVENPDVVKYEEENGTSDTPHPIMSQGMFYAGKKDKTELVKCLYVDKSERGQAIELIGDKAAVGMRQLDKIVRFALDNNLFDNYTFGVNGKNNLIFAVLRDIGIITNEEFEYHSNRLFGVDDDEEESDYIGAVAPDLGNIEEDNIESNSKGTSKGKDFYNQGNPSTTQPSINQNFNNINNNDRPKRNKQQNYQSEQYRAKGQVYSEELKIENNPFKLYKSEGTLDTINALRKITNIIMKDVGRVIGDYSLITKFEILGDGVLVFNDTVYTPKFEQSFIDSLPVVLQNKIEQGLLAEFFNLRTIYKFKNLQELVIESNNLAQGRARKEMGIGYRKRFLVLFKKFKNLHYINIGGVEYTRENPDTASEEGYLLPKEGFFKSIFKSKTPERFEETTGWMGKVYNFKPVKAIVNAVGWTMGVQTVFLLANLLGPWGLFFGALATANAYKEIKGSGVLGDSKSNKTENKSRWGLGNNKRDLERTVYFTVNKEKGFKIIFYTDNNVLKSYNPKAAIQEEYHRIVGQGGSGVIKEYTDGAQEISELRQAQPLPQKSSKGKGTGNTHYNEG